MDLDVLLCDHAQVAGGKLFVAGANIDRVGLPAGTPPPYLVNFALAGVVHVPWTATNNEHSLGFVLLTEDSQRPAFPPQMEGQDIRGEMRFNVGRPPHLASGEEQLVPFAFNFQGIPLMQTGRYVLELELDGTSARRVNLSLTVEQQSLIRGPGGPADYNLPR